MPGHVGRRGIWGVLKIRLKAIFKKNVLIDASPTELFSSRTLWCYKDVALMGLSPIKKPDKLLIGFI
jgi:hypothetical protein